MKLVHRSASGELKSQVLATDVEVADTAFKQTRGLMFKSNIPSDYALVFPFNSPSTRLVHMLFVRMAIDVVFTVNQKVQAVETLSPWVGHARYRADRIIELPANAAKQVKMGDRVTLSKSV
jgi:hypothetical protein